MYNHITDDQEGKAQLLENGAGFYIGEDMRDMRPVDKQETPPGCEQTPAGLLFWLGAC